MAISSIYQRFYRFTPYLFSATLCLSMFLVGVARYRCFLAYAVCLLIVFAVNVLQRDATFFERLTVVAGLIAAYYDIRYGQIFPLYDFNLFYAILLYVAFELLLNKQIRLFVENLSDGYVFSCCTICMHESYGLVTECVECGYSKVDCSEETSTGAEINYKQYGICEKGYLFELEPNEEVLAVVSLPICSLTMFYYNKTKELIDHLYVTNKKLVFLRSKCIDRGWTYRKYLYAPDIASYQIKTVKKWLSLEISDSQNNTYDLRVHNRQKASNIHNEIMTNLIECNEHIKTETGGFR